MWIVDIFLSKDVEHGATRQGGKRKTTERVHGCSEGGRVRYQR